MAKNSIPIRTDPSFKEMLNSIKLEKVKNGTNKTLLSDRRLTQAIVRVPNLREILIKSKIEDDK